MAQTIDVSGLSQPVVQELQRLVAVLRGDPAPPGVSAPVLSLDEFEQILDELSDGLPPLPPLPRGFSRADIYSDHG